jgi:RNA polymerase nonessential primary-like sigma factor
MLASSLFVETTENDSLSNYSLDEIEATKDNPHKLNEDLVELDFENIDPENPNRRGNRTTTDLVRLYLQEIGRVPLLERDEEVSEAQKVQRHILILEQRGETAEKGDEILTEFVEVINVHDRLVTQLSHRPSIKRWAKTVGMEIPELKEILAKGRQRWSEISGYSVKELEKIQRDGIRAKEHMIKANLRLVVSVAKKYQNRGLELLDLIQEGT